MVFFRRKGLSFSVLVINDRANGVIFELPFVCQDSAVAAEHEGIVVSGLVVMVFFTGPNPFAIQSVSSDQFQNFIQSLKSCVVDVETLPSGWVSHSLAVRSKHLGRLGLSFFEFVYSCTDVLVDSDSIFFVCHKNYELSYCGIR